MQAIGRWGNYFNQELYGPPTTLPWGIPIDCAHRVAAYACTEFPEASTASTRCSCTSRSREPRGAVPRLARVPLRRSLRPGDLLLVFFIWYGTTRFLLENLRSENWTFYGVPTATLVSIVFIAIGIGGLIHRHRPRHAPDAPPLHPDVATWGAIGDPELFAEALAAAEAGDGERIDEPWAHAGDLPGATRGCRPRRWASGRRTTTTSRTMRTTSDEIGDEASDDEDAPDPRPTG
jgi:hypothetical protein